MTKSKKKKNDYCASVHTVYIHIFNQIQGRLKLMVTRYPMVSSFQRLVTKIG